jgi:hypothetical protein
MYQGVRLLAPMAEGRGSRAVADISTVLDRSGGRSKSLDAGAEPARPLRRMAVKSRFVV